MNIGGNGPHGLYLVITKIRKGLFFMPTEVMHHEIFD